MAEKYTVILLYPDYATQDFGADIYVQTTMAEDGYKATEIVQRYAEGDNVDDETGEPAIPADDFRCIAVIKGDVHLELDATCF